MTEPVPPVRVAPDATLTLTQVPVSELAKRVLVVGDPGRAQKVAEEYLTDAREVGRNREYVTYTGTYKGTRVSVMSHGVGSPGAAVAFEELCRGGVERIIRSGTCGGLQPHILDGSIVVATGAVRREGVTSHMVPAEFPAIADPEITLELWRSAQATGLEHFRGIVLTSDLFYPHPVLGEEHEMWQQAGCVAVEMEVAALLVTASLHGVAAGAVLAVDGNPLAAQDSNMADYSPFREIVHQAVAGALTTALDALVALARRSAQARPLMTAFCALRTLLDCPEMGATHGCTL